MIPDVQSARSLRARAIDRVGIRDLSLPLCLRDSGREHHAVGRWSVAVGLPAERRGTHMSRMIQALEQQASALTVPGLADLAGELAARLDAEAVELSVATTWFRRKPAPISGIVSHLDHAVTLRAWRLGERATLGVDVAVPVTTLCPCSKEISRYGAHNQRSIVELAASFEPDRPVELDRLIELAEASASAPVYAVLKRADEKHLTELAYDNPKFVEDLVRDVAAALDAEPGLLDWRVTVDNLESIHNHSAWAEIRSAR